MPKKTKKELGKMGKMIQDRRRELQAKNKSLGYREAIAKAAKQLKAEGEFK